MTVWKPPDPDELRERLAEWLAPRVGAARVELQPGGFGDVSYFYATWEDGVRAICVRMEPEATDVLPGADLELKARVLEALRDSELAVPEVLAIEHDASVLGAPFLVLGGVDGRAPSDEQPCHVGAWLHEVPPEARDRVWWTAVDSLVDVNMVDIDGVGFLPVVGAKEQLERDRAYATWVLRGREHPLLFETFDRLAASVPKEVEPAFCWGDARLGNISCERSGPVEAVLDWETIRLGDPVADLAWLLVVERHHHGVDERVEEYPSIEDTIEDWQEQTGRGTESLGWWTTLCAARYDAILTRVSDLMEDEIVEDGDTLLRVIVDEQSI